MLDNSAAAHMIARYGYVAILAGTMLEGETIVLAAGYLAHQGYLSVPWIIIFAIIGSSISDQGLFFLSRIKGTSLLSRFPKIAAKVRALSEKMRSKPFALTAFALFFRFFYGLRNIAPIFLGMTSLATSRFVILNALGAILWSTTFTCLGYTFSRLLNAFMGTVAKVEMYGLLLLICGSMAFFAYRRWKKVKDLQQPEKTEGTPKQTATAEDSSTKAARSQ